MQFVLWFYYLENLYISKRVRKVAIEKSRKICYYKHTNFLDLIRQG